MVADRQEMERQAALDRARARAAAMERARDRASSLNTPAKEFGHGATLGIANTVGLPVDAVNALLNAAGIGVSEPAGGGDHIVDVLAELGMSPEDLPEEPVGPIGGAGEAIGITAALTPAMLAPFMERAMDPNFEALQGAESRAFTGTSDAPIPRSRAARAAFLLKQLGEQVARTAVKNPKTFVGAELAGSAAAGAAMEAARAEGADPGAQALAGVGAGVAGSMTAAGIPRSIQSMWRWGMRNLFPFTDAGGRSRAAAQIQARVEDPEAAALALRDPSTEGMTPGRRTGERRIMAQERLITDQDPSIDLAVRQDLEDAVRRTQRELRDLYDTPQGKSDWEYAVIQRVAPERINRGEVEEMVDAAYRQFRPLYDDAKGYPIRNRLMTNRTTTLDTMMSNVPKSRAVMAGDAERTKVDRWLQNKMTALRRKLKSIDGEKVFYDSGDLLRLRSDIRDEARRQTRLGNGEEANLLRVAESRITMLLKDQLPESAIRALRDTDERYRNYKIVEDAVYRSRDKGLTPDALLQSLRASSSSKGRYARGDQMELRSVAAAGRPVSSLLNNPDQLSRVVAQMSAEGQLNAKNQFLDELMTRATSLTDLGPDGRELISGIKLRGLLNKHKRAADALGFTEDELSRLEQVIGAVQRAERADEAAVSRLFEDGPSTIMELAATLIGAKSGQRIAEGGIGSSMVMASYGANKWRGFLSRFTEDKAVDLMKRAVRDPDLFEALLLQPNAMPAKKNEAFQLLMSALAEPGRRAAESGEEELAELRRMMEELTR